MAQSYGLHELNGSEIDVLPDVPLVGTTGDDDLSVWTRQLMYHDLPLTKAYGLGDDDTFYGDPALLYGGGGNDLFYNDGIGVYDRDQPQIAESHGGGGHDRFIDFYGSTWYYGGTGRDHFTNNYFTSHSYEGDKDFAFLGDHNDSAEVIFVTTSTFEGTFLEDRLISIDGGKGIDTLTLRSVNNYGSFWGDAGGVLDFGRFSGNDYASVHNMQAKSFERFDIRAILGEVDHIKLGRFGDRLEIASTIVNRLEDFPEDYVQPATSVAIEAKAGNDTIIGEGAELSETIFAGNGSDLVFSEGSYFGYGDTLYGGNDNDALVATSFRQTSVDVTMIGGAGRDLFVVGRGYREDIDISDFQSGADRLVFNDPRFWNYSFNYSVADIWAGLDPALTTTVITDDDNRLELRVTLSRPFGSPSSQDILYDRVTGILSTRENPDYHPWRELVTLTGGPEFAANDLWFL
jgi:hypothetical protein